jgi:membrane-associated phospholipid phosphatase
MEMKKIAKDAGIALVCSFLITVLFLLIVAFVAFMIVGRLIAGVHWFTDIIGGAILSAGLVAGYSFILKCTQFYENSKGNNYDT